MSDTDEDPGGLELQAQPGGASDADHSQTSGDVTVSRHRSLPELAALIVVLIALCVVFSLKSPYFLNQSNFINIFEAVAVTGIIAIPGTMLLVAGQFDLSVGSGAAFCGVVMAALIPNHGIGLAVVVGLLMGILIGLINGALVSVIGVNALITTLGMLAVLRGLAQVLSDGQTMIINNFDALGTGRPIPGIPFPVILFLILTIVAVVAMRFTVFGRSIYAVGSNPIAARLVGIRPRWIIFISFILSGLAVAVSGLILNSQLGAASPNTATGLELSVITAIVLGGASLHGGRGTIFGTFIGLVIIGVLNNGLILLNINSFYQDVARGILLILAVSFDQLRQKYFM